MRQTQADVRGTAHVGTDDFADLFHVHATRLVRLAALLGDPDPEDVVQEAFCRVYGVRGRLGDDGSGRTRSRSSWRRACPTWTDVSQLFLPVDNVPGRRNPYGLWALYDLDGTVASVKAYRADGETTGTVDMTSDTWAGRLHLVLEPFHEVDRVVVTLRRDAVAPGESRTRTYTPEELPGYWADLHR